MTEHKTHFLDTAHLLCPLPVLKARKTLSSMQTGEELTVIATDPMAQIDIPHMCQEDGHSLVSQTAHADVLTFVIRCGDHKNVE